MILVERFDFLCITVQDREISKKFYIEKLDFEVVQEFETEKAVIIELEGTRLKLIEEEGFTGANNNNIYLSFEMDVDDFTDALVSLEEEGIDLIGKPMAEEGGESAYISDPDGYKIKLAYRE